MAVDVVKEVSGPAWLKKLPIRLGPGMVLPLLLLLLLLMLAMLLSNCSREVFDNYHHTAISNTLIAWTGLGGLGGDESRQSNVDIEMDLTEESTSGGSPTNATAATRQMAYQSMNSGPVSSRVSLNGILLLLLLLIPVLLLLLLTSFPM